MLCSLLSPCRLQKEQSTEGKEDLLSDTKRNRSQEEEEDQQEQEQERDINNAATRCLVKPS